MKRSVWPHEDVKQELENYKDSPVFLYCPEDQDWFDYYGVQSLPTTIIVDEKGITIKRYVGFMSVDHILDFLRIGDE